jgi:hemerythrin-like domain-containing protein
MQVQLAGHVQRSDGPLFLLLGCHQRIRTFTALAQRVVGGAPAPREQVRDAAVSVYRYFDEALPKHVSDEEQSLDPRLRFAFPELAPLLVEMAAQHREIETFLGQLLPFWKLVADEPEATADLDQMRATTQRFAALWQPHLTLEERELFPALERLGPQDRLEIWHEMRERRAKPGR